VEAVACDLDRTLVAGDLVIRPRSLAAIAAVRAAGVPFVIATGRMFQSARPYALAAGLDEPLICYQGAAVVDPLSGEFLLHEPIPTEMARELIAAVEEESFALNVYVGDELYVARRTVESESYADFQNLELHEVGDVRAWLSEPPTKLVAIGEPRSLDGLAARLRQRFADRFFIAKSLPHFLEFARRGVSKGSGLRFVADRLGFSLARTVAIGDGENDRELLEVAGFGIAVEDADDRLLAIADDLCPPAAEEGVAQVLEQLLARRRAAGGEYIRPVDLFGA
jgi:Cof subfamily protein (haloacid dehalogenase superfamily)